MSDSPFPMINDDMSIYYNYTKNSQGQTFVK